jgi:hypothetical protein
VKSSTASPFLFLPGGAITDDLRRFVDMPGRMILRAPSPIDFDASHYMKKQVMTTVNKDQGRRVSSGAQEALTAKAP